MVSDGAGIGTPLHGRPGRDAGDRRGRRRPGRGFHAGEYHRLRVGSYRVVYIVEAGLITISRIDRVHA
jgi:hypothetical protein